LTWIEEHKNRKFYVIEDYGDKVRLKGVNFIVGKEFLMGV
jgi:hypothetical protein